MLRVGFFSDGVTREWWSHRAFGSNSSKLVHQFVLGSNSFFGVWRVNRLLVSAERVTQNRGQLGKKSWMKWELGVAGGAAPSWRGSGCSIWAKHKG